MQPCMDKKNRIIDSYQISRIMERCGGKKKTNLSFDKFTMCLPIRRHAIGLVMTLPKEFLALNMKSDLFFCVNCAIRYNFKEYHFDMVYACQWKKMVNQPIDQFQPLKSKQMLRI